MRVRDVAPETEPRLTATVSRVIDGDTVEIAYDNGETESVRLLGVDTPETHTDTKPGEFSGVPDDESGAEGLGFAGERASAYVKERIPPGTEVGIAFDPESEYRGFFGRLLAYIYVDGQQLNYQLVERGYARKYPNTIADNDQYLRAQSDARLARRGVWAYAEDSSHFLDIERVHAKNPGSDVADAEEEHVVFTNEGEGAVDLSNWLVEDSTGERFVFPEGTTVGAGETLTLHTGVGTDTDDEVYWGRARAVWHHEDDRIRVKNGNGWVVFEHDY